MPTSTITHDHERRMNSLPRSIVLRKQNNSLQSRLVTLLKHLWSPDDLRVRKAEWQILQSHKTREQIRRYYARSLHKVIDETDMVILVLDPRGPEDSRRLVEEEAHARCNPTLRGIASRRRHPNHSFVFRNVAVFGRTRTSWWLFELNITSTTNEAQIQRHYLRSLNNAIDESDTVIPMMDIRDPGDFGASVRLKWFDGLQGSDRPPISMGCVIFGNTSTLPSRSSSYRQLPDLSFATAPVLLLVLKASKLS
ncbi:hypothetical protein BU15DRAFT_65639 [Melanogaster broomeanus]|nr:hypothetical protein BU15DRAFT_65639 [Melanogaster broomeanus]